MKKKICLLALALAAFSANALAEEPTYISGPYLGLQAGYTYMDYKGTDYVASTNSHADSNRFTSRIYGGYAFTEHLATELGYTYFSNPRFRDNGTNTTVDISHSSVDLNAKAMLAFDHGFGAYLKAGAAWIHRGSVDNSSAVFLQRPSSNKITPLVGGAFTYDFTPHIMADLGWTHTFSNGDLPKFDIFALGIAYKF